MGFRNWLRGKLADAVCDSYAAENQQFHDEIERLRAALQPFADVCEFYESLHEMEQVSGGDENGDRGILVLDLRNARAALMSCQQ